MGALLAVSWRHRVKLRARASCGASRHYTGANGLPACCGAKRNAVSWAASTPNLDHSIQGLRVQRSRSTQETTAVNCLAIVISGSVEEHLQEIQEYSQGHGVPILVVDDRRVS